MVKLLAKNNDKKIQQNNGTCQELIQININIEIIVSKVYSIIKWILKYFNCL